MPEPVANSSAAGEPRPTHQVRGRFAPSPTGPLHFGSLVTALASFLDARARGGAWHVRIEDLDRARCHRSHADTILRQLESHGLTWDGDIVWQGSRGERYADILASLTAAGRIYACACSRQDIAAEAALVIEQGQLHPEAYPGTCRHGLPPGRKARSYRLAVPPGLVEFVDRIQGPVSQDVAAEVGDFVVKRADGPYAYQLAVIADDADLGITDVVRGADLLDSTARQIALHRLLGWPVPRYAHVPLAVDRHGRKLSKQNLAPTLGQHPAARELADALGFLGLPPPADLARSNTAEVLSWAIAHFDLGRIPSVPATPALPAYCGA
ncbi:MAG: tRNA glutamyl-Q(34) synthetase GluQRS [Rhodocyclaceae bacterium]|nr:tRNA glutamyl-Q(34) synthetase GluQRS [Rhodocyclaceae bacterium]